MSVHSSEMPPEVVAAFTSAAITALQELVQIDAVDEPATAPSEGEIVSATMNLVRPIPGVMSLLLSAESAAFLASRYLPRESSLSQELIDDVAGEFANVIAGQAKTMLKGTPYHFTLSTPVVVRAGRLADLLIAPDAKLVTSLAFESGRLLVLVNLATSGA